MRLISEIATEIEKKWPKVSAYARPYLDAMKKLSGPQDRYICDPADEIVIRFLHNAQGWRGDDAKRIKAELKAMFGMK